MTVFTGGALAGNGHGNENAPGQVKQELGIQSAQTIAQAADVQAAAAQSEQQAAAQPMPAPACRRRPLPR
jgi:hypothetical protein